MFGLLNLIIIWSNFQLLKRKEDTRLGYGPEDSEEIKVSISFQYNMIFRYQSYVRISLSQFSNRLNSPNDELTDG